MTKEKNSNLDIQTNLSKYGIGTKNKVTYLPLGTKQKVLIKVRAATEYWIKGSLTTSKAWVRFQQHPNVFLSLGNSL